DRRVRATCSDDAAGDRNRAGTGGLPGGEAFGSKAVRSVRRAMGLDRSFPQAQQPRETEGENETQQQQPAPESHQSNAQRNPERRIIVRARCGKYSGRSTNSRPKGRTTRNSKQPTRSVR